MEIPPSDLPEPSDRRANGVHLPVQAVRRTPGQPPCDGSGKAGRRPHRLRRLARRVLRHRRHLVANRHDHGAVRGDELFFELGEQTRIVVCGYAVAAEELPVA